ncbi:MAG: hypothetical protein HC837_11095 [Chloroflexaceae bacterium]|nr:hypothetical protein [Chloroflexaceae bacterium]
MSWFDWLDQMVQRMNREYERRIRAASEVTEYGAGHGHGHGHDHHGTSEHDSGIHDDMVMDDQAEDPDHDDGAIDIMNVPRGTRFRRSSDDTAQTESHQ